IDDRVGGTFQLRPVVRAEVRAPVAGFLKVVQVDQGDVVAAGSVIASLEIPDLVSRLAQKQADFEEVAAHLRLLEPGVRPEEITEQRRRVQRAIAWRNLARSDLARHRNTFEHELAALNRQTVVRETEWNFAGDNLKRVAALRARGAASEEAL